MINIAKELEDIGFAPFSVDGRKLTLKSKGYSCGWDLEYILRTEGDVDGRASHKLKQVLPDKTKIILKVPCVIETHELVKLIKYIVKNYEN